MPSHLEKILAGVRKDLEARKAAVPHQAIVQRAMLNDRKRAIGERLGDGPGIIAEIKRASPSRGWIRRDLDAAETARAYETGGACAVSVLTEGRYFGGALDDLSAAGGACGAVPLLRKDFILDEYMVAESRAFGADMVLLIVAVLGKETARFLKEASSFGMEALVEVHDEREMEIAAGCGAALVGINNRDLSTLKVDLGTSKRLLPMAPAGVVKVVESGISSPSDVRMLYEMGADAFLVGEALVRSEDPGAAIGMMRGELKGAKR